MRCYNSLNTTKIINIFNFPSNVLEVGFDCMKAV